MPAPHPPPPTGKNTKSIVSSGMSSRISIAMEDDPAII